MSAIDEVRVKCACPRQWNRIRYELDRGLPCWMERIRNMGQTSAVEARKRGCSFSDQQIFEGAVKAVLSNSTDWSRIERILSEIKDLFSNFDLDYYSCLNESEIDRTFMPWFKEHKTASLYQAKSHRSHRDRKKVKML